MPQDKSLLQQRRINMYEDEYHDENINDVIYHLENQVHDLKQSLKSAEVDLAFFEKSTQLLSKEIKQWKITVAKLQQANEAYAKLLDIDQIVCNTNTSLEEKLEELLDYEKIDKPQRH